MTMSVMMIRRGSSSARAFTLRPAVAKKIGVNTASAMVDSRWCTESGSRGS